VYNNNIDKIQIAEETNTIDGDTCMAIPDFQTIMLPILRMLGDRNEHALSDCVARIEEEYKLTDEDKATLNESGQRTIYNRTAWACTYLKRFGLLQAPRRGYYAITSKGEDVLGLPLKKITKKMLTENDFSEDTAKNVESENEAIFSQNPPNEIIGTLINEINEQLANDILELIYKNPSTFFEKLVVDLLLKMGYGGFDNSGQVTGQTRDGGIDGIVKQDILGLDSIYVQAKCWDKEKAVDRPEVHKFVGALAGANASKGVFITTSYFSSGALKYVEKISTAKVILINGAELAMLMIKYNLGVSIGDTYYIKRIDSDYFENA
jgi:restriction system protein